MKISRTGRPSFAKLKRKVSNQLNFPYIHDFADATKSVSLVKLKRRKKKLKSKKTFYLPLLGTLGGSRKKMAKNIIPKVATNRNV